MVSGIAMHEELCVLTEAGWRPYDRLWAGKGARFTAKTSFVPGSEPLPQAHRDWPEVRFEPDHCILVVDDNGMNREMAQALLGEMGLKAQWAEGGSEGVDLALQLRPDLVLMDLHMPRVNGFDALRRIREHPNGKTMTVIAFSADAFRRQQEAAREAGFSDFLTKPLEMA